MNHWHLCKRHNVLSMTGRCYLCDLEAAQRAAFGGAAHVEAQLVASEWSDEVDEDRLAFEFYQASGEWRDE